MAGAAEAAPSAHDPLMGGVAGIVLAAGSSRRMEGVCKLLLPLGDHTVVRCVVEAALKSGLSPVIAVLGDQAADVGEALQGTGARLVNNSRFQSGQGTSVSAGVRTAQESPAVEAVAILLGDEPGIRPGAIRAVVEGWRVSRAPAARAVYRDRCGHPVVLERSLFSMVVDLEGDRGAAELLTSLGTSVQSVPLEDTAPVDMDTWGDYESEVDRWESGMP